MEWLTYIRKKLFLRAFNKATPNVDETYKVNLAVTTIGILFDGTTAADRVPVENLIQELRDNGHEVYPLGYIDNYSVATTYAFKHFYKKNLTFHYLPKHPDVDKFLAKNYTILMNLASAENLPLHYIAKKTHARFKIGPFQNGVEMYDLMVQPSDSENTASLISHIKRILKSIQYSDE